MRTDRIFMRLGVLGVTCLVLIVTQSLSSEAQENWLPNQAGRWKPLEVDLECCREDYKLTQREYDTYMEKLKRLAGIPRELKVLNPPLGVEARTSLSILSPPYSDVERHRPYIPVVGLLRLMLVPYFAVGNGQIDLDPDNGAWLTFYVNDLIPIFSGERYTHKEVVEDWVASGGEPPQMEDEQGLYFLAPKVVGDLRGFPIYDTAAVILAKRDKPLWIPVSQERFLRYALRRARELLETQKEDLRKAMEGAPPDVVRDAEKDQREGDAKLRASLAETPGFIRFLLADYVQALTQELASLSPAERAAPAYYYPDWKTTRRPSGLLDPADPKAQAVVSPNPDFFNPTLPRTAIQVIVVLGISARDRPPAHPEKANPAATRRFEVRQALDWTKVAALVE